MKNISLLLLLLFPVYCLHAQSDSARKALHDRLLNQLFAAQSTASHFGAKTTGAAERLSSMNIYQDPNAAGTWARTDSARLTYSGIHGSVFNMATMSYYPLTSSGLYDSLYYYKYDSVVKEDIYTRKYLNDLMIDFFHSTVGDTNATEWKYRYDAAGRNIFYREFAVTPHPNNFWWNGEYYLYNTKGQKIQDSAVVSLTADTNSATIPTEKWDYTYNIIGDPTDVYGSYFSGSWYPDFHNIYIYAPVHKLIALHQYDAAPELFQVDSFSYSSGIPYYTFHSDSLFNTSTGLMDFQESDQKYTNASGLVDSMIYLKANYKEVHYYSYTALGNPSVDSVIVFRGGMLDSEAVVHYFYKPVPLGLQPLYTSANDIQIYPNPAAATLYIRSPAIKAPVLLMLYNAQGQLAATTTLAMTTGYSHFEIESLTPGIYFLTLTDEEGTVLKKQTIIKQ